MTREEKIQRRADILEEYKSLPMINLTSEDIEEMSDRYQEKLEIIELKKELDKEYTQLGEELGITSSTLYERARNIILILLVSFAMFSCERGSFSQSGRTPQLVKSNEKVIILSEGEYRVIDKYFVYKVKVLSSNTVGYSSSQFVYSINDTILVSKENIRY